MQMFNVENRYLCAQKYFLLFIRFYMKLFPIAMQEFNPFYPHLVLYDRKHFCSILTNLSNLLFLFYQKFPLLSYDVKNSLAKRFPKMRMLLFANVLQKQWLRDVLGNITEFTEKHLCQSLFINKVAGFSLSLQFY